MAAPLFLFDFDGPILDVSHKYHRLYSDLLRAEGFEPLSLAEFWSAKRAKVPDQVILGRSGAEGFLEKYSRLRNERIEQDEYLALDRLQDGAVEVLKEVSSRGTLALVTLRTHPDQAVRQVGWLGLDRFFSAILARSGGNDPRWTVKLEMVEKHFGKNLPRPAVFVGDTETDIRTGKALGCTTIAVLDGIRTPELIAAEGPDVQIPSIRHLLPLIPSLSQDFV